MGVTRALEVLEKLEKLVDAAGVGLHRLEFNTKIITLYLPKLLNHHRPDSS